MDVNGGAKTHQVHDFFERNQLRNLSFCTDHCMGRSPAVDPWFNPMEYVLLFGTQKKQIQDVGY